jgi:hypothetical protein
VDKMLEKFIFKEVNDVPTNVIHYSPKDRGVVQTLKDFISRYDSIKQRAYNQQRIIDGQRQTLETNREIIQSQQEVIESLKLTIRDLKISISEGKYKRD